MDRKLHGAQALGILVLVVVAIGAGMYWFGKKDNGQFSFAKTRIVSKTNKTIAADVQTYQNTTQGFQIKFPVGSAGRWKEDIQFDDAIQKLFYGTFSVSSADKKNTFQLMINQFGERTPLLPALEFITLNDKELTLFGNKTKGTIFSRAETSEYSILGTWCINSSLQAEAPITNASGSEANTRCQTSDFNLYDFNLYCEGGQAGSCETTFNQILSSFTLTDALPKLRLLLEVETRGGLCAGEKICTTKESIFSDASWTSSNHQAGELSVRPVKTLEDLMRTTDLNAIKKTKFTGVCPTAIDGQETTYTFHTATGPIAISSCESQIDMNSQLFQVIESILKDIREPG